MFTTSKTQVEHRQITVQLRHFVITQMAIAFVLLMAFSIGLTNTVSAATLNSTNGTTAHAPSTTTTTSK